MREGREVPVREGRVVLAREGREVLVRKERAMGREVDGREELLREVLVTREEAARSLR